MVSYDDLTRTVTEMVPGEHLTVQELYARAVEKSAPNPVLASLMDAAMYFEIDPGKTKLARNQLSSIVSVSHGENPVVPVEVKKAKLPAPIVEKKPEPVAAAATK